MNIIESRLIVGAARAFRVVHLSDTHLTYADMRDGDRKVSLALKRSRIFPDAEDVLADAVKLSNELQLPILHTGDLIDFVSMSNLEKAGEFASMCDLFFAAGNHEFSLYVGETKEDANYRNQSLANVQAVFKNNIRMASRVIGGVNFVALDNGYYLFDNEQADFLRSEVDKGLPVVLMVHNPLFERKLYDLQMSKSPCAYLTAVPAELMSSYPQERFEQQSADSTTTDVVRFIENEPLIKAVLTGHLHYDYEGVVAGRLPQIVTGKTTARIIEFL